MGYVSLQEGIFQLWGVLLGGITVFSSMGFLWGVMIHHIDPQK